ncbi:MAG: ABC transporter substrate-binding protein [Candidatus Electrothrix aestuarii]|uniref:Thiamine pyrimidine synthase n=1 Tax=Candidatus Electrothrix aestuarii TaxID=3062594 RepID=A0AAU8LUC7_9BACT|nr:ABC transporter substrate-binding protein [Candidatus Electrothrix aestuarii]
MYKKYKKRISFFPLLFAALFAVLTVFGSAQAEEQEIRYRLKWLFNTSVAGDIYADKAGYFARQGLRVTVREGSPEKNAINELELGRAEFGVASADQVIQALDKGARLVVLAQIFQVNPMQWIYRADQPEIKTLIDLRGRKIGITFGGNDETIMHTLLAQAGIKKNEVRLSGVRFDFTPFFRRKVDVWPVYRNSQGVILQDKLAKEGEAVRFFNPATFGMNFVANSVITSEKMVKEHPQTVKKFLTALLQGWEAAMQLENETKVLAAVKELEKNTDAAIMQQQLASTRELVMGNGKNFGTIDLAAWQQTEKIMLQAGQIKRAVQIEKYLQVQ